MDEFLAFLGIVGVLLLAPVPIFTALFMLLLAAIALLKKFWKKKEKNVDSRTDS